MLCDLVANAHQTLHCAYYIILDKKQIIFGGMKRGRK